VNRRDFITSMASAATAIPAATFAPAACSVLSLSKGGLAQQSATKKLPLSAPLTHSDWMLKPSAPPWGPAGVRAMLDACKECGWSHIYWRVFDAGVSTYKSKLLRPGDKAEPDNYFAPASDADLAIRNKFSPLTPEKSAQVLEQLNAMDYSTFDSLAAAIDYGHTIGLKIHAWASINEDDHGWGWPSEFTKAHPEFRWVRRDGQPYHSQLSFAFPEVREYKLALIDELIANYDLDGLFLDWIRTGDVRDNPQTDTAGVADSGYEQPNIDAFEKQYKIDPHEVPNNDDRWVRTRAEPQTQFMRDVRARIARHKKPLPVAVMVGHPWHYRGLLDPIDGNLRGLLLDVRTWANEALIDAAIPAGYYRPGGDAAKAYQALAAETQNKVDLWYYAWVPNTPDEFMRDFNAATALGAKRMLFWEADYIADRAQAPVLKKTMSEYAKW
jgi:hypothetical protein